MTTLFSKCARCGDELSKETTYEEMLRHFNSECFEMTILEVLDLNEPSEVKINRILV